MQLPARSVPVCRRPATGVLVCVGCGGGVRGGGVGCVGCGGGGGGGGRRGEGVGAGGCQRVDEMSFPFDVALCGPWPDTPP